MTLGPRRTISPGSPRGASLPSGPTTLTSKPYGRPGVPILSLPGGNGLEKMLPQHSVDPMASMRRSLNFSSNARCKDGASGAEDERMNRIRARASSIPSARGSIQSSSWVMMVGTRADHVQWFCVSHCQKERTRNRWGMTTEPPVSREGTRVTFSALM